MFRKHLGGVGEPLQSYNSKFHRQHLVVHGSNPHDNDEIDVGKAGDEALDLESKLFLVCLMF